LVITNFISQPNLVDVAHIATEFKQNLSTPTKWVSIGRSARSAYVMIDEDELRADEQQ